MARIKETALSILIASVLLLSAARVTAQSPNPESSRDQVSQAQPSESNTQQQKSETTRASEHAEVPTPSRQEVSAQQNQHQADCYLQTAWRWIVSHWSVNHTIALATSVYAFIAILQWCALKKTVDETQGLVKTANRQAKAAEDQVANLEKTLAATQEAADAAKESATAAKGALHINRPFVWVLPIVYFPSEQEVRFTYQNLGNSAAEIIEIKASPRNYFGSVDVPPAMFIPEVSYDGIPTIRIGTPILPVGAQSDPIRVPVDIDAGVGIYGQLPFQKANRLAFIGQIKYRGGAPDEYYVTPFFYWFSRGAEGFFYRGPEELNRRT